MNELQQLEAAISGLETQRSLLGDALVDAALGPMRAQLVVLRAAATPPCAPPAAAQALKLVTIVFVDMVGSTQLAARLDAEDMLELFSKVLGALARVVVAHHGRVVRFTGDGLKAVFGAEQALEDDPEHAVRCGLALLAAAKVQARQLSHQQAPDEMEFQIRVGIHTGHVALGGGVEGVDTVSGSAVHIAARMEQAGPPGALRISHDTYRHVRGLFDVQVQPPLQVKGVDAPMTTYLVQRAAPRARHGAARGVEGISTRMIGRDAELHVLQTAFLRLCSERTPATVTVVAEAGVGKSRLLHEFRAWAAARREGFHAFFGRATPQMQGQPYGLLRDLLAWRFQIADDDTLELARTKMEQGIVPLFLHDDGPDFAEGHAHLLAHQIGIDMRSSRHLRGILDDAMQIRGRALHAAAQVLRRVGAVDGLPVLLQLEDLHWADNESLDFLMQLAQVNRDVPMLTLAFSRGTLFERRPDWGRTEGRQQRVDLGPLDAACSLVLADELLARLPQVPPLLRQLLVAGAEGNPFYMEELVKMLIDQGAILTHGTAPDGWQLDLARLRATEVPTTLTGVLQARLDGLPAAERSSLQAASVIGPVFGEQALNALDEQALLSLPALMRRTLAVRLHAAADRADDRQHDFAFKHHILHQVTYGLVLKRTRRALHGRLADWLAAQTGLRANDFLGQTADHYELAGDDARAAEFHARAAEHARSRLAHEAVLSHVARALVLMQAPRAAAATVAHAGSIADQQRLRWRLLNARERTLNVQGERAAQRADIEALDQLADALADDSRRAHAAYRRGMLSLRTGDWPACEQAARNGMALAAKAGELETRLLCTRMVGLAQAKRGQLAAGHSLVHGAMLQAREGGLLAVECLCLNALAVMASIRSDAVAMLDFATQDLAISRRIGNRRGEASSLSNVGCGWMDLGEHARAQQALEEGLRLLRAIGDRVVEAATLSCLSTVAGRLGDVVQAGVWAQAAVDTAAAVQARDMEAIALSKLGNAEWALGHGGAATSAYQSSCELAELLQEPVQHDARAGLARVALAQGQLDEAMNHVAVMLAQLAAGGTLQGAEEPRRIELTLHQVLAGAGDARADDWLALAHSRLQASAATVTDGALRQSFLHHIPAHREILAAWSTRLPVETGRQTGGTGTQ